MTPEDVISFCHLLTQNKIPTWIVGGWGIDALLGEQTRPHKDLDILMLVDDVARLLVLLEREGYHFAYFWEENRFVQDREGRTTATAFVWKGDAGREIDAHALWLDDQGNGIIGWIREDGFQLLREDLAGHGLIAGVEVQCMSPETQVRAHSGYELPETQKRDMERIRARFGLKY